MESQSPPGFPEWIVPWLLAILGGVVTALSGAFAWIFRSFSSQANRNRHDINNLKLEVVTKVGTVQHQASVDTIGRAIAAHVDIIGKTTAELVSRRELIEIMRQHAENIERVANNQSAALLRSEQRMHEDRKLLHSELREDIDAVRQDIRSVHSRIDEKFK